MQKRFLFIVIIFLVIIFSFGCDSLFGPDKKADVVMFEGPIFEDGYTIFYVKGRVKNQGDNTAEFTQITIYIRDSAGGLIAQETTYIDDNYLSPGNTSPWSVIFSDSEHNIRDQMDFDETTYEIKWDEAE
jgi:SLAP domain-containing protein